jgi:F0F1-type ATP synthase membrane subunit c/vacuolar-type H+-ATPase subunit K
MWIIVGLAEAMYFINVGLAFYFLTNFGSQS